MFRKSICTKDAYGNIQNELNREREHENEYLGRIVVGKREKRERGRRKKVSDRTWKTENGIEEDIRGTSKTALDY